MKGLIYIVAILETFNVLNAKTIFNDNLPLHHKLGEKLLGENYKSWLSRIRLKKRLKENANFDYGVPFRDNPTKHPPSHFVGFRNNSICIESKKWGIEEKIDVDPHVSLVHGTLKKKFIKFPDDNLIPPGVKMTKGKMLESDIQVARLNSVITFIL